MELKEEGPENSAALTISRQTGEVEMHRHPEVVEMHRQEGELDLHWHSLIEAAGPASQGAGLARL